MMRSCSKSRNPSPSSTTSFYHILFVSLPIIDVFALITTLLVCYLNTRKTDPSRLLFPNELSQTDPERIIFSIGISLSAFLSFLISSLKYKQISSIFDGTVNRVSYIFGIFGALSQFMLANIPFEGKLMIVNITASAGCLIFSILYCCLHAYLTRNTPVISSKCVYITRIILLEFALLSGAVLSVFLVPDLSHWNQSPHNVAQIASLCCFSFLAAYKLTFINDLKQMYFHIHILISSSQADALYREPMNRRLLIDDDSASTRISTRSKISRSSVKSTGTMSETNTVFNYPATRKSSV